MDAPLPNPKKYSDCSITLCGSEMIQKQLLVSLSDESKVACVFALEDLNAIIETLRSFPQKKLKHKTLLHDLLQLRRAAFNVPL